MPGLEQISSFYLPWLRAASDLREMLEPIQVSVPPPLIAGAREGRLCRGGSRRRGPEASLAGHRGVGFHGGWGHGTALATELWM